MKTCNIKALNWTLGIVLAILSIVTSLADNFDSSWFEPILIVTSLIAGGIAILVGLWFQVLFHSLYQGSFRLSLTVLVRYR